MIVSRTLDQNITTAVSLKHRDLQFIYPLTKHVEENGGNQDLANRTAHLAASAATSSALALTALAILQDTHPRQNKLPNEPEGANFIFY